MIGTRIAIWAIEAASIGGLLLCSGAATALAQEEPGSAPTEAPQTEAPQAEAPQAEAPQAEAPQAEAPQAEAPQAEAPQAEAPQAEAPQAEAPQAEAPQAEPSDETPVAPVASRSPVVSTLDFEAAAYLSLTFADLPVPDAGSLNPIGGGAYATIRYVPRTFPFHAYFQAGGGLFATGTTTGPSGAKYANVLSALFFSPGVGLDLGDLRLTVGLGPALVFTSHSSEREDGSSSTGLAFSGDVGISYRFFKKTPWATSVSLRYQTVPGAKIDALSLGLVVRFGSIVYR